MKIKFVLWMSVSILIMFTACNTGTKTPGSETGEEVAEALGVLSGTGVGVIMEEEWISLFDGETTKGWREYNKDGFPESGWEVVDGALHCLESNKEFDDDRNANIITTQKFKWFELSLEWKISEAGNSGIFYLVQEVPDLEIYWSAPEMQVLDNEKHSDAEAGQDGNHQAGSLYDMIPAVPQNAKPAGEWNEVRIIVYKGKVEHWQNGEKVVEYELWTDAWYAMVDSSKFASYPTFRDPAKKGHIGLQDHTDEVWYRNIKIKKLY